jgi:hypothetical protein
VPFDIGGSPESSCLPVRRLPRRLSGGALSPAANGGAPGWRTDVSNR